MSLERVLEIAHKIRNVFEKIDERPSWGLCGLCGRASVQLFLACRRAGIEGVELWDKEDGYHTFNVYRGDVIDITATQFDNKRPKVFVIPLIEAQRQFDEYDKAERQFNHRRNWIYKEKFQSKHIRSDYQRVRRALGF